LGAFYKLTLYHPGPPSNIAHKDGPSLTDFLTGAPNLNSFPSGHMVRTVVAYGLIAFVIHRLALWRLARALAIPIAVVLVVIQAFDRLYLDAHWESDVIGGVLLGAIALLSATVWLDRPRRTDNWAVEASPSPDPGHGRPPQRCRTPRRGPGRSASPGSLLGDPDGP